MPAYRPLSASGPRLRRERGQKERRKEGKRCCWRLNMARLAHLQTHSNLDYLRKTKPVKKKSSMGWKRFPRPLPYQRMAVAGC